MTHTDGTLHTHIIQAVFLNIPPSGFQHFQKIYLINRSSIVNDRMEPNVKRGFIFGGKKTLPDAGLCDWFKLDLHLLRVHMHINMKWRFTKKIVALALHYICFL